MKWQEWQTLADNAAYWDDRNEKGLLKAEYVAGHTLRLWFEDDLDVSIYELDFYPLLVEENPGGVFDVLRDAERFRCARGEYALIWPDPETGADDGQTIDVAPECVRFFCERYGKVLKTSPSRAAWTDKCAA
ncbi:hypothetical protein [Candidatus Electronema sp. TJ]|uniref:hypothetical protein n=1 Tax=Candidatus Electronema sp. TJ TaxID=3401573 RepID=UPI003AA8A604